MVFDLDGPFHRQDGSTGITATSAALAFGRDDLDVIQIPPVLLTRRIRNHRITIGRTDGNASL